MMVSDTADPKERTRHGQPQTPVGLKNAANVCYANAILQAYATLPAFRNQIYRYRFKPGSPAPAEMDDAAEQAYWSGKFVRAAVPSRPDPTNDAEARVVIGQE